MKMPFGKHKDKEIHTIPQDYLIWFRNNITNLKGDLLQAVEAGIDGKLFDPKKRTIDDARREMLDKLRLRSIKLETC